MSVDLSCGCAVSARSGVPHGDPCPRHLAIEREHNLHPVIPWEWPLEPDGEPAEPVAPVEWRTCIVCGEVDGHSDACGLLEACQRAIATGETQHIRRAP